MKMEPRTLNELIDKLRFIDDETWGKYALSRDLLQARIPEERKHQLICNAIQCGKEYAVKIMKEATSSNPKKIAQYLQIKVEFSGISMTGKRALFAQYTPPNLIEIMQEPLCKIQEIGNDKKEKNLMDYFHKEQLVNIILAHEIFHYVEERFESEIYTRTEKITLWNFFGWKNNSTIRALSEIAAMAFAKQINALAYSPFLLDVVLYYGYNKEGARSIYEDIVEISVTE